MENERRNELAWYYLIKYYVNQPIWALGEVDINVRTFLNSAVEYETHSFSMELCCAVVQSANPLLPFQEIEKLTPKRRNELAWKVFVQLKNNGEMKKEPVSHHMEKKGYIKPPTVGEKSIFGF